MREIVVVALRQEGKAALAQDAASALVELVDEMAIISIGTLALLVRTGEIQVRLAREQIQAMAERLFAAADKRVNVIAGKIAEANEQLEYVDVSVSRPRHHGGATTADDGIAGPTRVARLGVEYRVHAGRNRANAKTGKRKPWQRERSGGAQRGTPHTANYFVFKAQSAAGSPGSSSDAG